MTQEREEEYLRRFQELKQQHEYSEMLEEHEQIPFLRVPLQPWVYDMMEAIVPSIIVLSTGVVVIHLLFGLYLLSEIEGFFDKTVALNNSHLCEL
jgi:hypothetical protein